MGRLMEMLMLAMIRILPEFAAVVKEGAALGLVIAALAIGALVEFRQGHIARPMIAVNALLLWQLFYADWSSLPTWLQVYLNGGSVVGVIAMASYTTKVSLPNGFYKVAFLVYGSLSIGIVIAALFAPWSPVA
jgi:hypothetical protein